MKTCRAGGGAAGVWLPPDSGHFQGHFFRPAPRLFVGGSVEDVWAATCALSAALLLQVGQVVMEGGGRCDGTETRAALRYAFEYEDVWRSAAHHAGGDREVLEIGRKFVLLGQYDLPFGRLNHFKGACV